jgi:CRP/FNR family transcriptional regulator
MSEREEVVPAGLRARTAGEGGPLRRGLGKDDRARLRALATKVRLDAGEVLFRQGDAADGVFTIANGVAKLFKSLPGDRRQISRFLFAGDFVGLSDREAQYGSTAQAITAAAVWRFERSPFAGFLFSNQGMCLELQGMQWRELEAAQEHMLLLARKSADQKVASFLLKLADVGSGRHDRVYLPMTRRDIADHLGLEVETVSRVLTGLQRRGLIALPEPFDARLLEREELEALAEGRQRRDDAPPR